MVQMAVAATAAEQQQQRSQEELAALQSSLTEAGKQKMHLQAQLQQLTAVHQRLQESSTTYQQELEGDARSA